MCSVHFNSPRRVELQSSLFHNVIYHALSIIEVYESQCQLQSLPSISSGMDRRLLGCDVVQSCRKLHFKRTYRLHFQKFPIPSHSLSAVKTNADYSVHLKTSVFGDEPHRMLKVVQRFAIFRVNMLVASINQ